MQAEAAGAQGADGCDVLPCPQGLRVVGGPGAAAYGVEHGADTAGWEAGDEERGGDRRTGGQTAPQRVSASRKCAPPWLMGTIFIYARGR
ncbi:hypothetical protein GCM10027074_52340 [Streptomyces deserti]